MSFWLLFCSLSTTKTFVKMVRFCAIFNCRNSSTRSKLGNITIYGFPKNLELRNLWLDASKDHVKTNIKLQNYGICENHFLPSDFKSLGSTKLNWHAIPSLFEGTKESRTKYFLYLKAKGK